MLSPSHPDGGFRTPDKMPVTFATPGLAIAFQGRRFDDVTDCILWVLVRPSRFVGNVARLGKLHTMFRSLRSGHVALSRLNLAIILTVAFTGGLWMARRTVAEGNRPEGTGNREVSQKHWLSAQEIKDRFATAQHEGFMRRAIANSRMAGIEKRTGGAFGAVIVDRNGRIVAEGSNHVVANFDPTWHGEMEAIRQACARLKVLKLDGCILYTSSEPCPMCLATAYWAGLDGIVYGAAVADSKKYGGFDDAFIYEQFAQPATARTIPELQILQDEAVTVWKEYASLSNNVPY
jgi:guanine deaminase